MLGVSGTHRTRHWRRVASKRKPWSRIVRRGGWRVVICGARRVLSFGPFERSVQALYK